MNNKEYCDMHAVMKLELESCKEDIKNLENKYDGIKEILTKTVHSIELLRQSIESEKENRDIWRDIMISRDEKLLTGLAEIQAKNTKEMIVSTAGIVNKMIKVPWYQPVISYVSGSLILGLILWIIYVLVEHAHLMPR